MLSEVLLYIPLTDDLGALLYVFLAGSYMVEQAPFQVL